MAVTASILNALTRDLLKVPKFHNHDGSPNEEYHRETYMWRLKIAGCLMVTLGWVGALTLFAFGLGLGDGFARASTVDEVRRDQIERRLDMIYTTICMEQNDDEGEVDPDVLELARKLEREYRTVNKDEPYEVNCPLLLKLRRQ